MLYHKVYTHPTSKEWVVFVHGAGGSSSIWFKQLKAYKEQFNCVLIDLRGHGRSQSTTKAFVSSDYTFKMVSQDVIDVLEHLQIYNAHFVGVSLGTIIIRNIAELDPSRVKSMVLGGAVTRLNVKSQFLMKIGDLGKNIVPYMWLYKLFAYIVMPQRGQNESRHLFVREAKKLCQKEFKRWFTLASHVNPMMRYFKENDINIPTLYLMGELDYMFIKPVRDMVEQHQYSQLLELADCGHVCNVEKPSQFNRESIRFIHANC